MLTNKFNLPKELVRAVQNDTYSRGDSDYTVTQLLKPPYICWLEKQHEPVEDVSDRLYSLYGQLIHGCIERFADDSSVVEKRLYVDILGKKVGGQLDHLENGVLSDWKFTTVWSSGGKDEWTAQLNMLRLILNLSQDEDVASHIPVHTLQIIAIYRDWSKGKAGFNGHPEHQVGVIPIEVWSDKKTLSFMEERVALHKADEPPPCSDEDRWYSGEKWAVMKKGRKSAVKLHDTEDEANEHLSTLGSDYYLEKREGEYKRCANYCSMSAHCPVWKRHLEDNAPIF